MSIQIQGDSRVVMSRTELKMQPTIHLEGKAGYLPHPYPGLRSKCIVGCIFFINSVWAHYYLCSFKRGDNCTRAANYIEINF
jgi:hypothetical protein